MQLKGPAHNLPSSPHTGTLTLTEHVSSPAWGASTAGWQSPSTCDFGADIWVWALSVCSSYEFKASNLQIRLSRPAPSLKHLLRRA